MRFFKEPAPSFRLWLNHHVVVVIAPVGAGTVVSSRWRAVSQVIDFRSQLRAELLGFDSPADAERAFPGAAGELAGGFSLPGESWSRDRSFLLFLGRALSWPLPPAEIFLMAERLRAIRDAHRKPCAMPLFAGRPVLCVDLMAKLDARSFYLKGWWRNCHGEASRLSAVSPEGEEHDLTSSAVHFPRDDIPAAFEGDRYVGFSVLLELDRPSPLPDGWRVEMQTPDGFVAEAPAPTVTGESSIILGKVLPDLQIGGDPGGRAAEQVDQSICRLLAHRLEKYHLSHELQCGTPVSNPLVSVIIPLYGRIDLMEHQLAHFSLDPGWARIELIYVLDSPEHWQRVAWRAEWLSRLYNVSLKVITSNCSGGYAAATNSGARLAQSKLLLLLNSDVLPVSPGWVEKMAGLYQSRFRVGAMGPKLLFEDNSIQHAGIGFCPSTDHFGWDTFAYFKGLHKNHPESDRARVVPAVTGACLMIDRELFWRTGGLDQGYVQGDFEDTDLCMRLREQGRENWYEPQIELYHLEGVSYPLSSRIANSVYNRWRHSRKWSAEIESAMAAMEKPFDRTAQIYA